MRRRRIVREESQFHLLAGAGLAALAGFAVGAFLMHKSGGLGAAILKLQTRLDRDGSGASDEEADYDGPPDSVYEMNRFVHDDGAYGETEDDIERDPDEDEVASEVETRVLTAFLNDPILSMAPVQISAQADGVVELRGWVYNDDDVLYAATIAGGVPGVIGVANNIRVRRPSRTRSS
jgi:hypothetical protein